MTGLAFAVFDQILYYLFFGKPSSIHYDYGMSWLMFSNCDLSIKRHFLQLVVKLFKCGSTIYHMYE